MILGHLQNASHLEAQVKKHKMSVTTFLPTALQLKQTLIDFVPIFVLHTVVSRDC